MGRGFPLIIKRMEDYDKQRLNLLQGHYATLNREMGEVHGELKTIRKLGYFDMVGRVAEVAALVIIITQLL